MKKEKKIMKNERINNKGFSLVELIVVIAIMAVLVGVLAPQFIKYVEKSRESTDVNAADEIGQALKTYFADEESSGTVTITMSHATSPVASGFAAATGNLALTSSGVDDAKLKSSQWSGDSIEVTLDLSSGKITKSGTATYLDANGNKK
jgi:type IV pilus assembly protein PilA